MFDLPLALSGCKVITEINILKISNFLLMPKKMCVCAYTISMNFT